MHILLLFILGALLGLLVSHLTDVRAHLPRFNNVAIGIIGALAGGMLPRGLGLTGPTGLVDIASLLTALIVAAALLAILIVLRRKVDGYV